MTIPIRIILTNPLPGVALRLQEGRDTLVPPTRSTAEETVFECGLRLGAPREGRPNFLGAAAQGPADGRFIYINAGRYAGQAGTCWDRRAKIPLGAITSDQVDAVTAAPGRRLEVRIAAVGKDGGPVCASVKLPADAWRVVEPRSA